VVACNTGETLSNQQAEAATKEDVLKTLSRATTKLRYQLGESLPSVEKFDVPVEVTTSSLEALRYYGIGLAVRHKEGDAAGVPFLRRAIELDPNFASAYSDLALSYDNLEQPSRALEAASKAYQLRERATRKEQLSITALYFSATGELDKEVETYELWIASYPHSAVPRANLGADYAMLGRYEKAVPEQQEALRLEPGNVNVYTSLGASYLYLNRLDDAKATFDLAVARKLDDGGLRQYMYYLAFARGDATQMQEDVAWAAGKPGDEDALLSVQSDTEAFYGRMNRARELSRRAVESALRADAKETAALWHASAAWHEAELNNREFARQEATAALALSQGRDVQVQAALALARVGDVDRASSLVQQLERNYPTNLLLKVYWLPSINAAIELSRNNPTKAIAILDAAVPYEQAGGLILYPPYLRGMAYLMNHNPTAALAEFQKMLDHKTIVQNFVTLSLVRLQIARAYLVAGDRAKAKAAYQEFFSLWNDADPDLPTLLRAKAEYAKLG